MSEQGDFLVSVTFKTTPENHAAALELLDRYIDGFLRHQPGFIESRLNELTEGTGYLHVARWQAESDFRAFAAKAQDHELLPEIRKLDASPAFYQVIRTYTPPG